MEKTIDVNGIPIPFKASGATTRRYRQRFQRDIFKDVGQLISESDGGKRALSIESLEIFENLAYIMAQQADPNVPEDPNDWLDQFEIFDIYQILPQLLELWNLNEATLEVPKKKAGRQSGR